MDDKQVSKNGRKPFRWKNSSAEMRCSLQAQPWQPARERKSGTSEVGITSRKTEKRGTKVSIQVEKPNSNLTRSLCRNHHTLARTSERLGKLR